MTIVKEFEHFYKGGRAPLAAPVGAGGIVFVIKHAEAHSLVATAILGVFAAVFTCNPLIRRVAVSFFARLPVRARIIQRVAGKVVRLGFAPGEIVSGVVRRCGAYIHICPLHSGRKPQVNRLRSEFGLVLYGDGAGCSEAAVNGFYGNGGLAQGHCGNCAVFGYRDHTGIAGRPGDLGIVGIFRHKPGHEVPRHTDCEHQGTGSDAHAGYRLCLIFTEDGADDFSAAAQSGSGAALGRIYVQSLGVGICRMQRGSPVIP